MNYQKKLTQYQQKGSTKDLIDKFSILNETKYFSSGICQNYLSGIFQNYLTFIPAKQLNVKYFKGTARINLWKKI